MGYPHEIRLRGPWDYMPLARLHRTTDDRQVESTTDLPVGGRTKLPTDWGATLGAEFYGRVCYRRRFGRPPHLDPHERLWLVVDGVDACGSVAVNEQPLGPVEGYAVPAEWDVTDLLEPRNQLDLTVELPDLCPELARLRRPGRDSLPGGPIRDVRLEVRGSHFIDRLGIDIAEQDDGVRLVAQGKVVGPATVQPLTLIVSGWTGELLAHHVVPGETFHCTADIERLSRGGSADADGLGGLATLSIRLVGQHGRMWEVERRTSHRTRRWDADAMQLIVDGDAFPLPVDRLRIPRPLSIAKFVGSWREDVPNVWLSETIWTESEYTFFDRNGWRLIQYVPTAWASRVCPMLSHHPSIVAWTTSAGENLLGEELLMSPSAGSRPWIPLELAGA